MPTRVRVVECSGHGSTRVRTLEDSVRTRMMSMAGHTCVSGAVVDALEYSSARIAHARTIDGVIVHHVPWFCVDVCSLVITADNCPPPGVASCAWRLARLGCHAGRVP